MEKEHIRNKVKTQKSLLTDAEKKRAAAEVFRKIENNAAFILAEKILMYHSLADELSTLDFLERWHNRKSFFLPRVNGVNLDILPYDKSRLSLGSFHIEEPEGDDVRNVEEIELIIVPGVAFDRNGNRVGRGKGYYDRMLGHSKATKIGVGYDFQFVEEDLDTEPHDVRVDVVVTESRTVIVRKK